MAYVAGETGFATLGVCVIAAVVLLRKAEGVADEPQASRLVASAPRTSATVPAA